MWNRILLCSTLVAMCLIFVLLPWIALAQLPTPPDFGSGSSSGDFWEYFKSAVIAIFSLAAVALLIIAILGAGSGLLNALKSGREKGEWGQFATTVVATILVLVLIVFGTVQIIKYIDAI